MFTITYQKEPTPRLLDACMRVWERALRTTHSFLTREEISLQKLLIRHVFLYGLDLYTMQDQGKIIAFMALARDTIEMLYVDPLYQGKKLGSQFLRFAQAYGFHKINVYEENKQALAIYLHWGFVIIDRKEKDPWGQEHPILFLAQPN